MPSSTSKSQPASQNKSSKEDASDKKLASLGKMLHSRFDTFSQKVAFVKRRFKGIRNPEALVADALRKAGLEKTK